MSATTSRVISSRPKALEKRRSDTGAKQPTSTVLYSHIILLIFCVFTLAPLVSILFISLYPDGQVINGLRPPESLNFANYARAWDAANFSVLMKSSVIVAITVVPIAAVISVLAGYAFATMKFKGSSLLFMLFLIGLLLPYEAPVVPLYFDLNQLGLSSSRLALILPEIALFLSFGVFWMRSSFGTDTQTLIEAARIDGANSWKILWKILVPNIMPALTTLLVLFFMWSWNEFLLALILAQGPSLQTVPAGIGLFLGEHTSDLRGLAAAAVIMSIPTLVVYAFLQRSFIQGVTSGGVKA